MKKYMDFLFPLIFIGLSCLGALIGVGTWAWVSNLKSSGEFVNWKLLEGNYKFVAIEEANSHSVWARTYNGDLYFWEFDCDENSACKKWIEVKQIPSDLHKTDNGELPIVKDKICPNVFESFPKEMPGKVIECVAGQYQTIVRFGRYYALLEDGMIWEWKTPIPNDGPNPALLIYLFCGFAIGSIIALVILINYYNSTKKQGNIYDK